MREAVTLNGMVLLSAPSGEFDRRLVLLTTGRGKITAFAHGARRPGNPLTVSYTHLDVYKRQSPPE